jgi:signal transduction histidine kinase
VRWGLSATLGTVAVAVVLFLAETQFAPLATADGSRLEVTRTVMRSSYLLVLTAMLAFTSAQDRVILAESNALSRVLAGIGVGSSFSDGLRLFIHECLVRTGSFQAVLAVENLATRQIYLWSASRRQGRGETTVVLEDLAQEDRETFFAPPPRELVVWHVRAKDKRWPARGLASATLERSMRTDGSFMGPLLDRYGISSALTADANGGEGWRARLVLFDPKAAALDDLYFLRGLVRHAGPALYNEFLVRRVRSRVSETERARLARELHDGLLQSLIGLEMEIEVLRRSAEPDPVPAAGLRQVRDQLRREIANVRDLMVQLRVVEMTGTSVLRIIAELAGRLRRENGLDVRLDSSCASLDCTPRACRHLARIVQEALTNVRKHSGAQSVRIALHASDSTNRLVIEDDGRGLGFSGRLTLDQLEARDYGPAVIKERVRAMGGDLAIESRPGAGVRIDVEWPRRAHV